jgi:hypothetical protein
VAVLCIGNYGRLEHLYGCQFMFSFMVKLTMTASFLTILAILSTFTFKGHINIKHNTPTVVAQRNINGEVGSHMTTPMVYIPFKKNPV